MKQGWESKKLGEVAKIGAGNSAPQDKSLFTNGVYPFFRTSDIGKIRIGGVSTAVDLLNDQGIKKLKLYPKGTILLPKSGASTFLNHRVILDVNGFVSSHLATVVCDEDLLDKRFALYYLIGIKAQDLIQDHSYPSLKLSDIKEIPIPIPSLEEQKQIVAKLDQCFEAIDKAKANAAKNLENAKELFQSKLNDIFSQKGEGWVESTFKEICSIITDGTHQTPKYFDSGYIFLSSKNVTSGKIDWDNVRYLDEEQHNKMYKRLAPKINDILLAKNGTTGVAAIVDIDKVFDIYVSLALLRPTELIHPYYLLHFINSIKAKKQFNKRLKGSGVPNLHLKEIREVIINYPSNIAKQKEISGYIDKLMVGTKSLESKYQQELNSLEELKKSILQKAFEGEL
jgi:type I restriction enzyme, S subunit